jgi:hypothetical protein
MSDASAEPRSGVCRVAGAAARLSFFRVMFRTPLSLDRTHRRITLISTGLIVVVLGIALITGKDGGLGVVAFLAAVLGASWAMGPRELVVDNGELRIERRAWRALRIRLAEIESAAPLNKIGKRALRLFGVGGFFGSYGLFWSDAIGKFRLYATRRGQALIVRRKNGLLPIVMTPDDVAGAIDAIDPRVHV